MMIPTPEEVDRAIEQLQAELDKPMTPREGRIVSQMDQLRAKARDLSPDQLRAVIDDLVENGGYEREDLEEWFSRKDVD